VGTIMDTVINPGTRKGRPNYSTDFKRRMAVAACAANVSVGKARLRFMMNTAHTHERIDNVVEVMLRLTLYSTEITHGLTSGMRPFVGAAKYFIRARAL